MSKEPQNQLTGNCRDPSSVQHFNQQWMNQKGCQKGLEEWMELVLDNSYAKISVTGNSNMFNF